MKRGGQCRAGPGALHAVGLCHKRGAQSSGTESFKGAAGQTAQPLLSWSEHTSILCPGEGHYLYPSRLFAL